MKERTIKKIYRAYRNDIQDLKTVTPIPSPEIEMIDPFLFLNHHGPQVYSPLNRGLPFGPHPHRGFQTVTFILEGDIAHRDSGGHESVIGPGGVQWMSAGRGLIHEEISSDAFKKAGGPMEILQLWINLPAKLKMSAPYYKGLQQNEIPVVENKDSKIQVIAGKHGDVVGPFQPSTDITVLTLALNSQGTITLPIPPEHNIFCYVVRGEVAASETKIPKMHLIDFENNGDAITLTAQADAFLLLCHALPYGEPVVAHGPFVMNTQQEIMQAFEDYRNGKLS